MSEPFDLDAVLGEPFTFTFCGEEYTLPVDVDWASSQRLAEGKPDEAIRRLLGEEQWARTEAAPKPFGSRSFTAVLDAYMTHLGLREGESEASPPSSVSTEEPSRLTSSATTTPTSAGSLTVLTG